MRALFYGTNTPNSTPDKNITIDIEDELGVGTWVGTTRSGTVTLSFQKGGTGSATTVIPRLPSHPVQIRWSRQNNIITENEGRYSTTFTLEGNTLTTQVGGVVYRRQ